MAKKDRTARLKLIINPGAGNPAETRGKLAAASAFLESSGFKVDVAKARPKGRATAIARRAVRDGYMLVVAMGGDGMVEAVMRALTGTKTRLGIIPTGVENNIACSLGIPRDIEQACLLISTENVCRMDVREVKTSRSKWFPFFEVVGIGFFLPLVPDGGSTAGESMVVPPLAASMPRRQKNPPRATLSMDDGKEMEVQARLLMVSNTPVFGKKYHVTQPSPAHEENLDISVFQGFTRDELRQYYANMKEGAYPMKGSIQRYQACRLKVKSSPRMKVMADGIDLGKGPVTIKVKPRALRVIAVEGGPSPVSEAHAETGGSSTSLPSSREDPLGFGL
jgi:diacylglycerol kinase (ATP)